MTTHHTGPVLELGGKAAALVLDDAPIQRLVQTMMSAILFNNGQMCIQPARLVIPEHRKDEIVAAFAEAFAQVVVGPPDAPGTELGPLISRTQYDHAMGLLKSAAEDDGRFVTGGERPPGLNTAFYVAPTIITDVSPRSRVGQEEIAADEQRHRIRRVRRRHGGGGPSGSRRGIGKVGG